MRLALSERKVSQINRLQKILRVFISLAAASTTLFAGVTAAHADSVNTTIQQRGGNGYCLGTQNGGTANGTAAIIWPCNGNPDQQWIVEDRGSSGTYEIVNVGSGKCLGNWYNTNQQQDTLIIWSCNNNADQTWTVTGEYGTTASLVSNGWGLCMSTYNQRSDGGDFAVQRTCDNGWDQNWYINTPFF